MFKIQKAEKIMENKENGKNLDGQNKNINSADVNATAEAPDSAAAEAPSNSTAQTEGTETNPNRYGNTLVDPTENKNSEADRNRSLLRSLGEKVRMNFMGYHPLEGLSNQNLQNIVNTKNANPTDRAMAAEEVLRRVKSGNYDSRNSDVGIKEDFANNYLGMVEGRIYAPTEAYKDYREALKRGEKVDYPKGVVREKLISTTEALNQAKEMTDDILEVCNRLGAKREVGRAYRETYELGLATDEVKEPTLDEVRKNVDYEDIIHDAVYWHLDDDRKPEFGKYNFHDKHPKLKALVENFVAENGIEFLKDTVASNYEKMNRKNLERKAVRYTISEGEFLPKTIKEDPDKADRLLQSLDIEKNGGQIILAALEGYNKKIDWATDGDSEPQTAIANYFNLKEELWNLMQDPEVFDGINKFGSIFKKEPYVVIRQKDTEIGKELSQRFENSKQEWLESVKTNPEYQETLEDAKHRALSAAGKPIIDDFDFSMLDSGVKNISFADYIDRDEIDKMAESFSFKHLTRDSQIRKYLDEGGVEFDPTKVARGALLDLLRSGHKETSRYETKTMEQFYYGKWHYNKRYIPIVASAEGMFSSEDYEKHKDKIGIDFSDPEVFDFAFEGLLNIMQKTNGPESRQAKWYFENIFMNDPKRFGQELDKQYKLSDSGDRARITRFRNKIMKNSEAYLGYLKGKELGEATGLKKENESEVLSVPDSMEATTYDEMKAFVDEYREGILHFLDRVAAKFEAFAEGKNLKTKDRKDDKVRLKPRKFAPDMFGVTKVAALIDFGKTLKDSGQIENVQFLTGRFPGENKDGATFAERYGKADFKSPRTYHGFAFDFENHRCGIFESLNDDAATYFFCGDAGDDPTEFFENSKLDSHKNKKVASVSHLSREHITDSISEVHKKGFLFFRTSDPDAVNYESLGRRKTWNKYFDVEFPAYPMNINEEPEENMPDLKAYREWQNSPEQNPDYEVVDERLKQYYFGEK